MFVFYIIISFPEFKSANEAFFLQRHIASRVLSSTTLACRFHGLLVDVGFSVWVLVVLHVAAMRVSGDIKSAATVPFVIPICHCRNLVVADGRL